VEGRVYAGIRELARIRAELPALHAAGASGVLELDDPHVLAWWRRHPRSGYFVGLVNVAEHEVTLDAGLLRRFGALETVHASDGPVRVEGRRVHLPGLAFAWLAEP
jgi:amylosucrase